MQWDMRIGVGEARMGRAPRKLGGGIVVVAVALGGCRATRMQRGASGAGEGDAGEVGGPGPGDAGLDVLVGMGGEGIVGGVCKRAHGGGTGRGGLRGRLQASSITRKGDAGATAYAVLGGGTFDGERRGRRALAALAALGERQERVLVAGARGLGLDGEIGVVFAGGGVVLAAVVDGKRARRRVDGVPQARGWRARGPLVEGAEVETEDAVGQRPAGGQHWRRSRRRRRRGGGA